MLDNDGAADITPYVTEKTVPALGDIAPDVLGSLKHEGKLYGLPISNYTMGLLINRKLFEQAGLDPDSPPRTWEEVRTAAKKIAGLGDGVAGFGEYSAANTGGWHFTAHMYSLGGDIVDASGKKAAFNNGLGKQIAENLHAMRWEDDSMGRTQLLKWGDLQKQIAFGTPTDLALGTRRARAAALLTLALPGAVYLYQGEELGLPEAEIPPERTQDPMYFRSGGADPGRDGCRVPLPWNADAPHCGFGSRTEPWLPQPEGWSMYAADRQAGDPGSMLALYRESVRLRRTLPGFGDGPLKWLPSAEGVLAFARTDGLVCVVNLAEQPAELPAPARVLLASGPLDAGGRLPRDTAVWLRT